VSCFLSLIVNVLKCGILQTVTDNEDAARELGERSAEVFILIVDHLRQTSPKTITSDMEHDALKLEE
jgi:hypothetical protein